MECYNNEVTVTYRDVDITEQLTMNALVDYMQETARCHAEILEVNYSAVRDDYYWIILRTKFQLDEPPRVGDKIRIETYIAGVERLYSVRCFNIYNEENQQVGHIIGYYMLMSKETHKPVKLQKIEGKEHIFGNKYEGEQVRKFGVELETVMGSTRRKAYSSDIDTNNHMNNAHYIRWIVDMFTTQELKEERISSIQIQYVREIHEGEEVEILKGVNAEGEICVVCRNDEGAVHFIGKVEKN